MSGVRFRMVTLCSAVVLVVLAAMPVQFSWNVVQPTTVYANGFIDFEDGIDGQIIESSIPGLYFTNTNGQDWVHGDWRTGNYNGKYPNGTYASNGNFFAWLGSTQGSGRIDFTQGDATYLSFFTSTSTGITAVGYDKDNNVITKASLNQGNTDTGKLDQVRVEAPSGKKLSYVIISGTANQWLIDDLTTDAAGVPNDRTPTIFLPGIAGTRMSNKFRNLWPDWPSLYGSLDDNHLDVMELKSDGVSPLKDEEAYKTVTVGDAIRKEATEDFYESFIGHMSDRGYKECSKPKEVCADGRLFVWGYDWRKDLKPSVADLTSYIEQVKTATGSSQVNLVAHSMGGLIARSYISNSTRAQNVSIMVTMGTPYLGAPKAFQAIHYTACLLDAAFKKCWLNRDQLHELAQNFPAMYQLTPSPNYFKVYPNGYINMDHDITNDGQKEGWLAYQQVSELLSTNNSNQESWKNGFYQTVDSYNNGTKGVRVYAFIGDGTKNETPGGMREFMRKTWFGFGSEEKAYDLNVVSGDKTVPLYSASLGRGSGAADFSGDVTMYYTADEHGGIPKNTNVQNLITDILETSGATANGFAGTSQTTSTFSASPNGILRVGKTMHMADTTTPSAPVRLQPQLLSGKQILLQGAATLVVTDVTGNVVKSTPQETVENIPGSSLEQLGSTTSVFLPDEGEYTFRIDGQGTDAVDLRLRTITDEQIKQTVVYKDIVVSEATVATLHYDTSSPDYALQIDSNGDGSTDRVEQPLSIVDPNASQDITPPTSSITLEGTKGPHNWHIGEVMVSIQATDNEGGSGVARVEYSLDGGQTVKTYTSPFSVDALSTPYILVRAIDKNGNGQVEFTRATIGPQRTFLPLSQR